MFNYSTLINDGYIREETRTCEIHFLTPNSKYFEKDKKQFELLSNLEERYKQECDKPIQFEYLHKAEFDAFGNLIPGTYLDENTHAWRTAFQKALSDSPFFQSLNQAELSKAKWFPVSTYETNFISKNRRLF